jgi:hypothetical protein
LMLSLQRLEIMTRMRSYGIGLWLF